MFWISLDIYLEYVLLGYEAFFFFFEDTPYCFQHLFDFLNFIYLFLERGEGMDKERERNIDVRGKQQPVASGTHPNCGRNLQPSHVP